MLCICDGVATVELLRFGVGQKSFGNLMSTACIVCLFWSPKAKDVAIFSFSSHQYSAPVLLAFHLIMTIFSLLQPLDHQQSHISISSRHNAQLTHNNISPMLREISLEAGNINTKHWCYLLSR